MLNGWKEGTIGVNGEVFHYWVKVYEEPSRFGIDEGRISKLMLKRGGKVVCNYDRGWDVKPDENDPVVMVAYSILLNDYM